MLISGESELGPEELSALESYIEGRLPGAKPIRLKGWGRGIIVKTDVSGEGSLRESAEFTVHGKTLRTVQTSGSIGKLKRRATGRAIVGQVHE